MDLIDALIYRDYDQVKNLLQLGANPNHTDDWMGITPLHAAIIYYAPLKVVTMLLAAGAKLHATTAEGDSPIDYARYRGRYDLLTLFNKISSL